MGYLSAPVPNSCTSHALGLVVVDVFDLDLDANGNQDSSDVLPYGESEVRSSLLADYTVIGNKFVKQFIEVPKTAAGALKLALRSLNAVGKQLNL